MRATLRRRLPWLVLAALVLALGCARADYRVRERARQDLDKLAQRLAIQSGGGEQALGQLDLSWLGLYPEVVQARVTAGSGRVLGSYQSAATAPIAYTATSGRDDVRVELAAALPGWTACTTELPLLLLSLVFLSLALPSRTESSASPAGEDRSDPSFHPRAAVHPVASQLVLELDAGLRIQQVSRGVERFGYTAADLIGTAMSDFVERFHPSHPHSVLGVSQAGGGRLDSLVRSSPISDERGTLEKVVVTLAPPSSQNDELNARYASLHRLCQAICDNARDSIFILDRSASVVYANAAFRDVLGGAGAPGEGVLEHLRPIHRLPFIDALLAATDGAESGLLEIELEKPSSTVLEGAFHTLTRPEDAAPGALAVGIFRDVSQARQLAQQLEQARLRAGHSQKIEALGRMAGGVAHDFNNLLATIVFNLEAARATLEPGDPVLTYLDELALAATKAGGVTRQLLLYSRKKPFELRRVSCHQAISDAVRLTQGMRGSVTVNVSLTASLDTVLLDDGQLDQVLVNLLVNAKDAIGSRGQIEITSENPSPDTIVVRVKDDGPGIPKELQTKIFEPYFTTKEVGKGTGLGLSTAVAVIEKAGGSLSVSSSEGGTTFEITLPVAERHETAPSAPTIAPPTPGSEPAVLLVEDETSIRNLLHRLLEECGYRVTSAATGSAAAQLLKGRQLFDVLVTDLVLPGVSGPDLAKAFQETRPGSPVLFMSGYPGDTLEESELAVKSRFLAKPFSPEQLLESLRQLLGQPV